MFGAEIPSSSAGPGAASPLPAVRGAGRPRRESRGAAAGGRPEKLEGDSDSIQTLLDDISVYIMCIYIYIYIIGFIVIMILHVYHACFVHFVYHV